MLRYLSIVLHCFFENIGCKLGTEDFEALLSRCFARVLTITLPTGARAQDAVNDDTLIKTILSEEMATWLEPTTLDATIESVMHEARFILPMIPGQVATSEIGKHVTALRQADHV